MGSRRSKRLSPDSILCSIEKMDLVRVDKKGLTIERADEKIFEKNAIEFH